MKTFQQWLVERGARTALANPFTPSLGHSKLQNPPNDWTPTSASVPVAIKNGLGRHKPCSEFNPRIDSKCGEQPQVKDGGPNVTNKKKNPYKSFYATEGYYRRRRGNDPKAYNLAVLNHLRTLSPAHGNALNAYGTRLGWWDTINFYRTQGMGPEEAAQKMAEEPLEEASREFQAYNEPSVPDIEGEYDKGGRERLSLIRGGPAYQPARLPNEILDKLGASASRPSGVRFNTGAGQEDWEDDDWEDDWEEPEDWESDWEEPEDWDWYDQYGVPEPEPEELEEPELEPEEPIRSRESKAELRARYPLQQSGDNTARKLRSTGKARNKMIGRLKTQKEREALVNQPVPGTRNTFAAASAPLAKGGWRTYTRNWKRYRPHQYHQD